MYRFKKKKYVSNFQQESLVQMNRPRFQYMALFRTDHTVYHFKYLYGKKNYDTLMYLIHNSLRFNEPWCITYMYGLNTQ